MKPILNTPAHRLIPALGLSLALGALAQNAHAEALQYGIQVEQLEYRSTDEENSLVWDFDAFVGSDELKLVWRSEGERAEDSGDLESLENQLRLQMPISRFFDAVAGVYAQTPDNRPERYAAVFGIKGLAPQWFEIDADLYVSDRSFFRFEGEYEVLLTNRLILTPSLEVNLPLQDDDAYLQAAGGATVEIGARLSYDLIDRSVSPYVGINYEKSFGGTADLMRAAGQEDDEFSIVTGIRLMF